MRTVLKGLESPSAPSMTLSTLGGESVSPVSQRRKQRPGHGTRPRPHGSSGHPSQRLASVPSPRRRTGPPPSPAVGAQLCTSVSEAPIPACLFLSLHLVNVPSLSADPGPLWFPLHLTCLLGPLRAVASARKGLCLSISPCFSFSPCPSSRPSHLREAITPGRLKPGLCDFLFLGSLRSSL